MKKFQKPVSLLLLAAVAAFSLANPAFAAEGDAQNYGELAYSHVEYLSETLGRRAAGSEQEIAAAQYIKDEFASYGMEVAEQPFSYTRGGSTVNSKNIIATLPAQENAENVGTIIVGAHLDSTGNGSQGAHDNASGIGVMLEAAENVVAPLDYNLVFIAFGAEEAGYRGSTYYVSQMSQDEIDNTITMINLDSLIGGDFLYVHGNAGVDGWVRDQIMARVDALDLNMRIQPGLNPDFPAGVGYPASDHVPFENVGIPYVNYESTNWEADQLDEDMTGYSETVEYGTIWHTNRDTLDFLEEAFPGRVENRLENAAHSLSDILANIDLSDDLTVSLGGPATVVEKEDASYVLSAKNMDKIATVTLWFEVDGDVFEGKSVKGLNGFDVLGQIEWQQSTGSLFTGRVTLTNNAGGVTNSKSFTDILEIALTSIEGQFGTSDVKISRILLSGYDAENQAVFAEATIQNSTASTEVVKFVSLYDVNRDGKVDQLDLTTAQLAFAAEEGDANWNVNADVDADGTVGIADFILILNHIVW
jgi:hypothetical protein